MKVDFSITPDTYAEYCPNCKKADLTFTKNEGSFLCSGCHEVLSRLLIIDPGLRWWLDESKIYWHESVGILLLNESAQILFYELTKFPFGLTVPAGHVDKGEVPVDAIIREAREEVGVDIDKPDVCVSTKIHGDSCRRGSDDHQWTLFIASISKTQRNSIVIDSHEGKKPMWLSFNEAVACLDGMPFAMRFLFTNHAEKIKATIFHKI